MTTLTGARSPDIIEFLGALPLFAGLRRPDLARLAEGAETLRLSAGELLMGEGDEADGLYLVRSGELEVSRLEGRRRVVLASAGPGSFVGEMALVGDSRRSATVRAVTAAMVVRISPAPFRSLIGSDAEAAMTILRTVLHRLRDTEAGLQRHARLASLGTLAAGLAHELNNPTAAIQRSAAQLRRAVATLDAAARRACSLTPEPESPFLPAAVHLGGSDRAAASDSRPPETPRPRPAIDAEEERLLDWLDDHGIDVADAVDAMLDRGWNVERLDAETAGREADATARFVEWVAARSLAEALADEIAIAAGAADQVVQSVRCYIHPAEGEASRAVDVQESLTNALVVLRSRLEPGVKVTTDFDPAVPPVLGLPAELGQVWTNLIGNALDAMGGSGRLEVTTRRADTDVVVLIADDGPGIDPEHIDRIFDPFFTTQPPGLGSGLGLHLVRNIVEKHRGRIDVESRPGRTVFEVVLPAADGGTD